MTRAAQHFRELLHLHEIGDRKRAYYSELLSFTQDQLAQKELIIRKDFKPPANVFGAVIYPEMV
ncbi:MAG: hypothetical protein GF372_03135 [Candidatus Marinimicrobia bacterium]|nr:hypothetical protein [Candidatus Neomarinimicrobiota bacterium]